ncbi:hypothetical protein [Bacteroides sp.]|uniref:hypothetical protein n=1 Tax=Bacteroides sp. TaxID=29523 RepID=UPI0026302149|nr:hypothetical protein [Bacteroides sp.]MDD3041190.1 hypothetical protein [Bacteroides sp.]
MKNDSGINNAGTFHIICRECDGTVFQNYEDPETYINTPTPEMLNQIVLKNSLRDIYKHETELELFDLFKAMMVRKEPKFASLFDMFLEPQRSARKLDINECYGVCNRAKAFIDDKLPWFELASYDLLDFVTPVAFQGMMAISTGMNGEIINNRFTTDINYKLEYLHLAILPLQNKTAVITIVDKSNERIKQFVFFLQTAPSATRLEVLNRMLFMYAEDYFFSKQLKDKTIKSLELVAQMLQDAGTVKGYENQALAREIRDYDLRRDIAIPNLLTKEYEVIKC